MKKTNIQKTIEQVKQSWDIYEVCELVQAVLGSEVFFDDSRAWSLYTREKPQAEKTPGYAAKYGAWRGYLGGGVRGSMNTNLTGELGQLFLAALGQIEDIINQDCDPEPWEKNTGVLLNN